MKTINNETLQAEKISFELLGKEHKGYTKKAMPAVLEALKQYKATGKYPYNNDVKNFILGLVKINANLHDHLETEIYLAQKDLRAEEEAKQQQEMADKGYIPCSQINGFTGDAELVATKPQDWMRHKIATIGKIVMDGNNNPFFIPKGKRTRGYYIKLLDNAFYKAIK